MAFNLFNVIATKLIAEQQRKTINPGLLFVSGILPGLTGIAIPLIAAKSAPPGDQDGSPTDSWTDVPDVSSDSSKFKNIEEAKKAINGDNQGEHKMISAEISSLREDVDSKINTLADHLETTSNELRDEIKESEARIVKAVQQGKNPSPLP